MSNSFHMSMTSGTSSAGPSGMFVAPGTQEFAAAVAAAAAQQADEDERPDNMELLVGDVKGKVSFDFDYHHEQDLSLMTLLFADRHFD